MELTVKQEKFVNAYLDTGNGTQAVLDAGYQVANKNSAGVVAHSNLRKANVMQAIAIKKATIAQQLEDNSLLLLTNLLDLAYNSPSDAIRLKALTDLLDRAGYSSKQNLTISGGDTAIQIETRHTSDLAKRARELLVEETND